MLDVAVKETKCSPAAGSARQRSARLSDVQLNGLSSVLKSARWTSAVPASYR
jgi:hypothetical protein